MKNRHNKTAAAFTLIEMLVVIAIIALLAGLIAGGGINAIAKGKIHRTQAELTNIKTAIEAYKAKKGFYPPDNFNGTTNFNAQTNGLYYELAGTILKLKADGSPDYYVTLDGQDWITNSGATNFFTVTPPPPALILAHSIGFANSSTITNQNDDNFTPENFLKGLPLNQAMTVTNSGVHIKLFMVGGDNTAPWNYISTSPTNNPGSYDLWADVIIRGKTNRICNWSDKPIVF